MFVGTQFDSFSEGCMPDVTASKVHGCERAMSTRYKHLRCKSCETYASIRFGALRYVPARDAYLQEMYICEIYA